MLKQRRLDAGLTQEKLSEISGVPVRTIQHLENGNIWNARGYTLFNLSKAFGIWMDCLLTDEYDTEVTDEGDD